MSEHDRHTTPPTDADGIIIDQLLDVLRRANLPHGRAVFMFGYITAGLVQHAVRNHSVPEPEAVQDFLELFGAGMGLMQLDISHEVINPH